MAGESTDNLEQLLSAYLDGELSEAQRRQVETLLRDSDGPARRLLEELRATIGAVQGLPRAQSSVEFMGRIRAHMERQALIGEQPAVGGPGSAVSTGRARAFAAAAVIGLAVLAGYVVWDVAGRGGNAGTLPMASARKHEAEQQPAGPIAKAPPAAPAAPGGVPPANTSSETKTALKETSVGQLARKEDRADLQRVMADQSPAVQTSPTAVAKPADKALAEAQIAELPPQTGTPPQLPSRGSRAKGNVYSDSAAGKQHETQLGAAADTAGQQLNVPAAEPKQPLDLQWLAQRRSEEQALKRLAPEASAAISEGPDQAAAAAVEPVAPAAVPPVEIGEAQLPARKPDPTAASKPSGAHTQPATAPATQPAATTPAP